MANVLIKYDPQGITRPDYRFIEKSGRSAIDIVLDELSVPLSLVVVYLNGEDLKLPVIDGSGEIVDFGDEEKLTRTLGDKDELKVMCVQQGDLSDALSLPFTVTKYLLKGVATALSWVYEVPSYSSNTETGETRNSLSGQKNQPNLYAAIPDRYGKSVIFPDMIDSEAYSIYSLDKQYLTQFMCLGVGEFVRQEFYLGDTRVSQVPGVDITIFSPASGITTIPDYYYSRSVSQVSRSDLPAPGSAKVAIASNDPSIFFTYASSSDYGHIRVEGSNVKPYFNDYFEIGDEIEITGADQIIGLGGTAYYDLSGTYTVGAVFDDAIVLLDVLSTTSDWQYIDSSYTTGETSYQSGSSVENIIFLDAGTAPVPVGPYYTAIPTRGFLLDFGFYSGLKGSVTLQIDYSVYDELDGTAIDSGTLEVKYSDDTLDQLNYTYEFNYGAIDDNSYYFGVTVTRLTAESTDAAKPDVVKWDRFAASARMTNKTFSNNVTLAKIVIPYSTSALSPSSNEVNVVATRKTITYNESTGEVDERLSSSRTFADALLHLYVVVHQRSESDLDLDSLYEISNRIGSDLNEFSYSFTDLSQSLEDKMTIICNVARVSFYWDGQKYRFRREEKQTSAPNIITRTDIASPADRQYSRSFSPSLPTSYDSVKVQYIYPDRNNEAAFIRLKYDSSGNIIEGLGVNPLSITLSGCRNKTQALNRAHLEVRRLIYQRWSLQDTLMKNGYLLDLGDYVQYTDVFRSDVYGGEILNIDGSTVYLSSLVTLEAGVSYELWYNDEYMNSHGPFAIVDGDGTTAKTVTVVNASDLANAYTRSGELGSNVQVGSRFTINKVADGQRELFTVAKKEGVDDQHVNITLAQYDERLFDYDD